MRTQEEKSKEHDKTRKAQKREREKRGKPIQEQQDYRKEQMYTQPPFPSVHSEITGTPNERKRKRKDKKRKTKKRGKRKVVCFASLCWPLLEPPGVLGKSERKETKRDRAAVERVAREKDGAAHRGSPC
eukprot:NODE_4929_length_743_cov_4.511527_g4573_i0.p1 GENE.NODE_4929_length_743_cov_4.511527_g4573_i0~~NODE_4929_length_743_cov_4.511527_g4573_i0.p1  ORF type:complete len:129 (-),score=10.26 NODE_4929_length_743_cov_4.511527_g4573_i0:356-742(-)